MKILKNFFVKQILASIALILFMNSSLNADFCSAPVPILAVPFVVPGPGVYRLDADVSIAAGTAITINNTRNVVIDLNDHTIDLLNTATNGILINASTDVVISSGCGIGTIKNTLAPLGTPTGNGIQITNGVTGGSRVIIENVTTRFLANGINMNPTIVAADSTLWSQELEIKNSVFRDGNVGITLVALGKNITIRNCQAINNKTSTATGNGLLLTTPIGSAIVENLVIESCIFDDNDTGVQFGPLTGGGSTGLFRDVLLQDCIITNSTSLGLACGRGAYNLTLNNCKLDACGVYSCYIQSGKNLIFNGCQISGGGRESMRLQQGCHTIAINNCIVADGVNRAAAILDATRLSIKNSIFSNSGSPITIPLLFVPSQTTEALLLVDILGADIDNCEFANNSTNPLSNGLSLYNCNGLLCQNSVFHCNGIGGNGLDGNAILLGAGDVNCTFRNCIVANRVPNSCQVGIRSTHDNVSPLSSTDNGSFFGNNSSIVIENTTVEGARENGIVFENTSNSSIINSTVQSTINGHGISLINSDGITLLSNIVSNNNGDGIRIDASTTSNQVQNNSIFNNELVGLNVFSRCPNNNMFHNFSNNNAAGDFSPFVPFQSSPSLTVGPLANIKSFTCPQLPSNLTGCKSEDIFLLQKELINILRWTAPTTGAIITSYLIYRDANLTQLIGTVPGNQTQFVDHNRSADTTYTYYVVSQDANNIMSVPVSVTVTANC